MAFQFAELYRIAGDRHDAVDPGGAFEWPSPIPGWRLFAIASNGLGWEHVSVQALDNAGHSRVPTWREMCDARAKFWDPEDVVMQLHPAESAYVNRHPAVLHLWRPIGATIPTPPVELV